jgi:ABC-type polysaccharide/polyol phosphate transport system ATPase subunit
VDEVLSVGDQQFKDRCAARIKQLVNEGRTLLFVSHMGDQVRSVCQRSIYLKSGSLIYDGETPLVLEKYEAAQKLAEGDAPGMQDGPGFPQQKSASKSTR